LKYLLLDDFWDDIGSGITGIAKTGANFFVPGSGKYIDSAVEAIPFRDLFGKLGVPAREKNKKNKAKNTVNAPLV